MGCFRNKALNNIMSEKSCHSSKHYAFWIWNDNGLHPEERHRKVGVGLSLRKHGFASQGAVS